MSLIGARVGKVSSVDIKTRTARVIFPDRADMVSAPLTVLQSSPLITVDITTHSSKWNVEAKYSSAPRKLDIDEEYTKSTPDNIAAELKADDHSLSVDVHGWLPYIGQTVLCIIMQDGEGDGYIIGGV